MDHRWIPNINGFVKSADALSMRPIASLNDFSSNQSLAVQK